jgi:hypothetical protein
VCEGRGFGRRCGRVGWRGSERCSGHERDKAIGRGSV